MFGYARSTKLVAAPNGRSTAPLRVLVVGAGVAGISVARGLLRDGHDVTVFERRPDVRAAGGAVTIWSNGETVLDQLGVDMDGAGQLLSTVRVVTSRGRPLATLDVTAMVRRLGAPVRMVPRRVLLERLLEGFEAERIRCDSRVIALVGAGDRVRVEFADGAVADGDVLIGADGLHSMVREWVGARDAKPTGWCSWQGLVTLPEFPEITDSGAALMIIGERGNLGLWPAGGSDVQWWFDLPWSYDFVRPQRPIEMIRSHFAGWSDPVDRVLATLTDDDLAHSPYPAFPASDSRARAPARSRCSAMPRTRCRPPSRRGPTRRCSTRWCCARRLRISVVGHASPALTFRAHCAGMRRPGDARSWPCPGWRRCRSSHGEFVLGPAALISGPAAGLRADDVSASTSHRRISAEISRNLGVPRRRTRRAR